MSIHDAFKWINEADKIVIGASNGFSISEGYHIFAKNEDFKNNFGYLSNKYGFGSIIHGCFQNFNSSQVEWTFNSILFNYLYDSYNPSELMLSLKNILNSKNNFIVTSNIDGHFVKSGFDKNSIFEIEGNCLEMQCKRCCNNETYDSIALLNQMYASQNDGLIPLNLVPKCPRCNSDMMIHIEVNRNFIKGKSWIDSYNKYKDFIKERNGEKIVYLELGVGARNQLIKAPFMDMVASNKNAKYISINKGEIFIPESIYERSIGIDADITSVIMEWSKSISELKEKSL